MIIEDLREALLALSGSKYMQEEGIDEAFAEMFARNSAHYDKLPASTQEKIKTQFGQMASTLSELEGVARQHSEEKVRKLAMWFKGVNLLLAQARVGAA